MRRKLRGEKRGAASQYTNTDTPREDLVKCQGKLLVAGRWEDVHKTGAQVVPWLRFCQSLGTGFPLRGKRMCFRPLLSIIFYHYV